MSMVLEYLNIKTYLCIFDIFPRTHTDILTGTGSLIQIVWLHIITRG